MKTTPEDDEVKDKISEDDMETITDKCYEDIKWLDANQLAEVEGFNDKLYQGSGGMPGGMLDMGRMGGGMPGA